MARKKNEEMVEESTPPTETPEAKPVTRREAVLQAVETLGWKAETGKLAAYIKENFNLEIPNKVIGIHIFHLRKERRKSAGSGTGATKAVSAGSSGKDVSFEEIRIMRSLLKRHGASRIRDLIDLLS